MNNNIRNTMLMIIVIFLSMVGMAYLITKM
jgi:hypothetical protein